MKTYRLVLNVRPLNMRIDSFAISNQVLQAVQEKFPELKVRVIDFAEV